MSVAITLRVMFRHAERDKYGECLSVPEIVVNGESRPLPATPTVAGLLAELRLADKPVAVEVNLELVPKPQHAERRLAAGDRIEVVTLVGGG